jgi:hypothetical protein
VATIRKAAGSMDKTEEMASLFEGKKQGCDYAPVDINRGVCLQRFRHVKMMSVCIVLLVLVGRGGKRDSHWGWGMFLKWGVGSGQGTSKGRDL